MRSTLGDRARGRLPHVALRPHRLSGAPRPVAIREGRGAGGLRPEGRRMYDVETRAEAEEWREEGDTFMHVRRYRLSPAAKPRIQKSS